MITINQQPYACSFTKNPVTFRVSSNMQYPSARVYPQMLIRVTNKMSSGLFIEFQFTNPQTLEIVTIRLAASNTDTFPGALPTTLFPGSVLLYAEEVEKRIKRIPVLNAFYEITRDVQYIYLTAKQPVEELCFVNLSTNQTTLFLQMVNTPTFNDPDQRAGYTMKASVFFEHEYLSDQYECVAYLTPYSDADSTAMIDIAGVLDAELEAGWEEMPMPVDTIADTKCLRRYYVEFLEYWDGEPEGRVTKSDVLFCHWGGVCTNDQLMIEPIAYLQSNNQWLTWWPSGKQVFDQQKDWLSWMNTGPDHTYKVVMILYKSTGTVEYELAERTLKRWESITIPVGYMQNDLPSLILPGEGLQKWGFVIRTETETFDRDVSPLMLYYLHRNQCLRHQVMYVNSFGVPETFMTAGFWKEVMNPDTQLAQRAVQFNDYRLKPGIFVFDSSHQVSIIAETCRMSKLEAYRLQSMLNAVLAFTWQDKRWIPVAITTEKAEVLIESEFTTELRVEMIVANLNDRASFYQTTPELIPVLSCGLTGFRLETNGLVIEDYGSVTIKLNGSSIAVDCEWDNDAQMYVCTSPVETTALYDATVEVADLDGSVYPLATSVQVTKKRITARYNQTGTFGFSIMGSEPTANLKIDFGVGSGFESKPYIDDWSYIGKTTSVPGEKVMIIEQSCFSDIVGLQCNEMYLTGFDFQQLTNLGQLSLNGSNISGTLYLSGLSQMNYLSLVSLEITAIDLGLMTDLANVIIGDCPLFVEAGIDNLIAQIYELRDHYWNAVNVQITGYGGTWSTTAQAMIDGTGIYTGNGLSTDYGFTFFIS